MSAAILSFPSIVSQVAAGIPTEKRLRPNECICPNCGLSRPGSIIRLGTRIVHEYVTCANDCQYENGEPVEVFTQADFDEGLPNAGASEFNKLMIAFDKATLCR